MQSRSRDLWVVCAMAMLAVVWALLRVDIVLLRVAFALPLALFLPGYVWAEIAFPAQAPDMATRVLVSSGASLAITAIGGLVLNATPWGLRAETWALLLGGITIAGCALAALRRSRNLVASTAVRGASLGGRGAALLGVAALIAAGAFAISHAGASQQNGAGFTQLWMVEDRQNPARINVGLANEETEPKEYRVQLSSGGAVLYEWRPVKLVPGQTWQIQVTLDQQAPISQPLQALLYLSDAPGLVYRQTTLWLSR
jgi:hypothetical protein